MEETENCTLLPAIAVASEGSETISGGIPTVIKASALVTTPNRFETTTSYAPAKESVTL